MSTYPLLCFPDETILFEKNFPKYLLQKGDKKIPVEPRQPVPPDAPTFSFSVTIFIAFMISMIVFIFTRDGSIAKPAFLIGLCVVPILYFVGKSNYDNANIEFREKCKTYDELRSEYLNRKSRFDKEKKELEENIKNPIWLDSEYKRYLLRKLKPLQLADIEYSNPKIGRTEKFFLSHLNQVFPNEISTDKVIEVFSYGNKKDSFGYDEWDNLIVYEPEKKQNAYCPDFIFSHSVTGLTINIEIDEPYNFSGNPVHTKYNEHDKKRNKYFTDFNWYVIRFSEKQVLKSPESCCLEIANMIYDLTGDDKYFQTMESVKPVNRDKMWTYEEAKEFSKRKERSSYSEFDKKYPKINPDLLLSPLQCGNYKFTFDYHYEFEQFDLRHNKIIHRGKYNMRKAIHGRYLIQIQWKQKWTSYYMNQLDIETIIFTEVNTGAQYIFQEYHPV